MKPAELGRHFEDLFGSVPRIFRAPGRVNLLGEHTDYNDGFVMPCAIGFSTRVAISPRQDRNLVIRSEDFSEQFEFDVDALPSQGQRCLVRLRCGHGGNASGDRPSYSRRDPAG